MAGLTEAHKPTHTLTFTPKLYLQICFRHLTCKHMTSGLNIYDDVVRESSDENTHFPYAETLLDLGPHQSSHNYP